MVVAGQGVGTEDADETLRVAALMYQHSNEAMMVSDDRNVIVSVNPAFTRVTGYSPEEVIGKNPNIISSGRHDRVFYQQMWNCILTKGSWQGEVWNRRKNGEEYAEWLKVNVIRNSAGEVYRYLAQFTDITEKKRSTELIWRQANFDALTGLPNRTMLRERLAQEIQRAARSKSLIAVLFIDLDHFNQVNDAFGHNAGDMLLAEAGRRISACVRTADTVARLGGDEFMVILPDVARGADAEPIHQKIQQALCAPFRTGDEVVYLSASIGITFYPDDALDSDDLLKNADQAMYAAKSEGRNSVTHFTPRMREKTLAKLRLISDLRGAFETGQFSAHFQPIVDLSSGMVRKAEALLRWRHPTRGMVSPAEFIPAAEESGLINEIGDWVFKEAARWSQYWGTLLGRPFPISVNKSPVQFLARRPLSWPEYLKQIGLPGSAIVMEITESMLLHATASVNEQLQQCRDAGIQVAIDDFGTGYSSMAYLKKFRIDFLKIDQSFVRDMAVNPGDRAIAEAIIVMAHKLGMKVIAEGVETDDQRKMLAAAGCDFGQGYLFAAPMPPEDFEVMLVASERAASEREPKLNLATR